MVNAGEQDGCCKPGEGLWRERSGRRRARCLAGCSRGAQQPSSCSSGWMWSLDPVKVFRVLLFARGNPPSRAKATAAAGTVGTNTEVPGRLGSVGNRRGARCGLCLCRGAGLTPKPRDMGMAKTESGDIPWKGTLICRERRRQCSAGVGEEITAVQCLKRFCGQGERWSKTDVRRKEIETCLKRGGEVNRSGKLKGAGV